jgi:hypothetical protein
MFPGKFNFVFAVYIRFVGTHFIVLAFYFALNDSFRPRRMRSEEEHAEQHEYQYGVMLGFVTSMQGYALYRERIMRRSRSEQRGRSIIRPIF